MFIILLTIAVVLLFFVILNIHLNRESLCQENNCKCSKKQIFRDIQKILWNDSKDNKDLISSILKGIADYFKVNNIYYCFNNRDNEECIISLNNGVPEDLAQQCSDLYNCKDSVFYFDLNEVFYARYCICIDDYIIGALYIDFGKKKNLTNEELRVLDLFSSFIVQKHKVEILEEALCKSEIDLETIMAHTTDGVVFVDKNGLIQRANKKSSHFSEFTVTDMINEKASQCFKSLDQKCSIHDLIQIALNKNSATEMQRSLLLTKNGIDISADLKAVPVFSMDNPQQADGVMIFMKDTEAERLAQIEKERNDKQKEKHYLELQSEVEQRKEVEKALIRSAALASAGTLAAGVAHEYNNINSITMGNIDVLLKMKDLPDFVIDTLKTIKKMTNRGAEITRSLLDYAKGSATSKEKREIVSLVDLAESTRNLVSKEFSKEGIRFSSNFDKLGEDKKSYMIFANSSQIKQAILNLVLNARHALSGRKEKTVSFVVGCDDESVLLRISDTGHGIEKQDLDKLFTPFFTTKGKFARYDSQKKFNGSGLGLAVTDMIIKEHGGKIDVNSEVGIGTTFVLKFNKIGDGNTSEKTDYNLSKDNVEEEVEIKNGNGSRILVLDDEEELCKLLANTLNGNGYIADFTDDGNDAIEWHKKDPYDLVITDIQMPKMSGAEFLNILSIIGEKDPKRIVMTGRVNKKDLDGLKMDEFVYKPFDLFDLMYKIQSILNL